MWNDKKLTNIEKLVQKVAAKYKVIRNGVNFVIDSTELGQIIIRPDNTGLRINGNNSGHIIGVSEWVESKLLKRKR